METNLLSFQETWLWDADSLNLLTLSAETTSVTLSAEMEVHFNGMLFAYYHLQ